MILQIPKDNIIRVEKIEKKESEVFSPEEMYEQMMLKEPPADDSAIDHLDFARRLQKISLYDKALEHLRKAYLLDPRIKERTQELHAELIQALEKQQGDELYNAILASLNKNDYARRAGETGPLCPELSRAPGTQQT